MEIRQLEYFLMVSRLNSFTRAAEQLHVSQPGVTTAIRSLEDELGIILFDRSQKQIILTAEGRIFHKHVENVMRDISVTIAGVNELKNLSRGTISIGVPPMAGIYLFPLIWSQFRKEHPSLEVILVEEDSPTVQNLLETNEIDAGFVLGSQHFPLLDIIPLNSLELVVCCSPVSPLAHRQTLSLYELADEHFIFTKEDDLISYCSFWDMRNIDNGVVHADSADDGSFFPTDNH